LIFMSFLTDPNILQKWINSQSHQFFAIQNSTRGITSQKDYAILTAEISRATFGMTPSEYKIFKNIPDKSIWESRYLEW
jgi:hypothetical protein